MSKVNIKKFVVPVIYLTAVMLIVFSVFLLTAGINKYLTVTKDYDYSTPIYFDNSVPVVKMQKQIVRPYISENVKIGKYFYDFESDEEKQTNSLIFYEDTYMQNSGVDYISDNPFDVVSVLEGEVISIEKDKVLGNIIKIKHNKNIITVYQGLNDIKVKKGNHVEQNSILGTSGPSKINANFLNSLHFEVYYNGVLIDPENFYNLNLEDL